MSRGLPPIFKVYHVTPLWWELQRRHRCIDLACSKLDIGKRSMCQSHHCHVHPRFVSQGQVVSEFSQSWQTQKKISILVLENHGLLLQFSASWRGMDQCHEALECCSFQIQVQITKSHRCRNRLHWFISFLFSLRWSTVGLQSREPTAAFHMRTTSWKAQLVHNAEKKPGICAQSHF